MILAALLAALMVPAAASATPYVSNYWSGYVAIAPFHPISTVDARFTIPTLNCKRTKNETQKSLVAGGGNGVAIWTGLDGFQTNTLEQDGVAGACLRGGKPIWRMFTEMVPGLPRFGPVVQPGWGINASVSSPAEGQSGVYHLSVQTSSGRFEDMATNSAEDLGAPNTTVETVIERPGGQKSMTAFDGVITTSTADYFANLSDEEGCPLGALFYQPTPCSHVQKVSLSGADVGLTRPKQGASPGHSVFSSSYK